MFDSSLNFSIISLGVFLDVCARACVCVCVCGFLVDFSCHDQTRLNLASVLYVELFPSHLLPTSHFSVLSSAGMSGHRYLYLLPHPELLILVYRILC